MGPIAEICEDFESFVLNLDFEQITDLTSILQQLPSLTLREGYVLDACKVGDEYGFRFRTYCRKATTAGVYPASKPVTIAELYADGGNDNEAVTHPLYTDDYELRGVYLPCNVSDIRPAIEYFKVPFTERGILDAWLLHVAHEFMPRTWHALYGKKTFIFSSDTIHEIIESSERKKSRTLEQWKDARERMLNLDPGALLPRISIDNDSATVEYSYWNDWKGLVREKLHAVRKDGGVRFEEPDKSVIVPFKSGSRY